MLPPKREDLLQVLEKYLNDFLKEQVNVKAGNSLNKEENTDQDILSHCHWLLREIINNVIEADEEDKLIDENYSLGFIQGVLYSQRKYSLSIMYCHNNGFTE